MHLFLASRNLVVATDNGQDETLGSEEKSASVLECPHKTHRPNNCNSTSDDLSSYYAAIMISLIIMTDFLSDVRIFQKCQN
jgi:hypothetical protein